MELHLKEGSRFEMATVSTPESRSGQHQGGRTAAAQPSGLPQLHAVVLLAGVVETIDAANAAAFLGTELQRVALRVAKANRAAHLHQKKRNPAKFKSFTSAGFSWSYVYWEKSFGFGIIVSCQGFNCENID